MTSLIRRISAALIPALLVAFTAALAADAKYDPEGYWDVAVDMGGTPLNAGMKVKKNPDGSYGGSLKSPLGDFSLAKVDYNGAEAISFGAKIGEGDKAISFKFDGKFTSNDAFEGTLVSETMGTMNVKGTRGKEPSPIAGVWEIVSDSQLGKLNRTLVVYKDGTAKYVTDADNAVTDLKVDGENVTFKTKVSAQGQELALAFKGTYKALALNGKFSGEEGGELATVTGKKSIKNIAAGAVGKWKFTAETPNGPYNADLIIDSPSSGKLISKEGEAALRKIGSDGDKFTYDVSVNYQGQNYDVSFAGIIKGDEMNGDFLMAGNPVATVKCKKEGPAKADSAANPAK